MAMSYLMLLMKLVLGFFLYLYVFHPLNLFFFFFFNDTATTEIYTLSLHDALPISMRSPPCRSFRAKVMAWSLAASPRTMRAASISEGDAWAELVPPRESSLDFPVASADSTAMPSRS